jgi:hypothetical protein
VFSHLAKSTRRDKVRLKALVTLPRAMLLRTVGTRRRSETVGCHVVELLTTSTLGGNNATPIGFDTDFYIAEVRQQ